MVIPNFFIIGSPRAGSTSLSFYLKNHPNVFMSDLKEPCYFDFDLLKSEKINFKSYLSLFLKADSAVHKAIGEASVTYLFSEVAVPEILKFNPDSKFIVILRDPISFLQSLHALRIFWGDENIMDFEAAWRAEPERINGNKIPISCREIKWLMYSEWGKIGDQVERLFSCVDKSRVKIIIFDDFVTDTKKAYEEVLAFLGVPSDGRTEFPIINERKNVKNILFQQISASLVHAAMIIRAKLGIGLKTYGLMTKILSINSNTKAKSSISESFKSELKNYYRDDVGKLSKLLGRDLSFWILDKKQEDF